jgi:4-methyl-5(b-hydroxyethyl)-thiazole monophosphate biosynthesis
MPTRGGKVGLRALVPLAAGFEEIEAVTIIDVLRRGGIEVLVAGLDGAGPVEGAHGITVQAPLALDTQRSAAFDLIVLPGGEPGTTHLAASAGLAAMLKAQAHAGRLLAAICAAPRVLAAQGLLDDRAATSFPGVETQVRSGGAVYSTARVVRDGNIITSRGPGTALEFALALVDALQGAEQAQEVREATLAS